MGYVKFDDRTDEMVFFQPDCIDAGQRETRYPVGKLLLQFLDTDFGEYERVRIRLIQQIQSGEYGPARATAAANAHIRDGRGYDLQRHPYFSRIPVRDDDGDRETALDLLQDHDYLHAQQQLGQALRICLDADAPVHLASFHCGERFMIGWTLDAFELPVKYDSIRAGYFFSDPRRPFAIYDDLLGARAPAHLPGSGARTWRDLSPDTLVHLKTTFRERPSFLQEGYADTDPLSLATLEFMKMVQSDIQVRACANCGRYFVLRRNPAQKYCDRPLSGGSRTCQNIGSLAKYKQRVQESPVLRAYTRAYNRKYNQLHVQGKITLQDFKDWEAQAAQYRNPARDGAFDEQKAIEWLDRS